MGCAPSAPQERAPAKKARAAGRYVYGGAVDAAAALPPPPPGGPTPAQQRAIAEALAKGTRLQIFWEDDEPPTWYSGTVMGWRVRVSGTSGSQNGST